MQCTFNPDSCIAAAFSHALLCASLCCCAGFLFVKGVNGFNEDAERQDKLDGYM